MRLRDVIITGSFAIGHDGQKEPLDWEEYALKLERQLLKSKEDEYNEDWMGIIERVEKDNSGIEMYSETVKWLQGNYLLLKIS